MLSNVGYGDDPSTDEVGDSVNNQACRFRITEANKHELRAAFDQVDCAFSCSQWAVGDDPRWQKRPSTSTFCGIRLGSINLPDAHAVPLSRLGRHRVQVAMERHGWSQQTREPAGRESPPLVAGSGVCHKLFDFESQHDGDGPGGDGLTGPTVTAALTPERKPRSVWRLRSSVMLP